MRSCHVRGFSTDSECCNLTPDQYGIGPGWDGYLQAWEQGGDGPVLRMQLRLWEISKYIKRDIWAFRSFLIGDLDFLAGCSWANLWTKTFQMDFCFKLSGEKEKADFNVVPQCFLCCIESASQLSNSLRHKSIHILK